MYVKDALASPHSACTHLCRRGRRLPNGSISARPSMTGCSMARACARALHSLPCLPARACRLGLLQCTAASVGAIIGGPVPYSCY
jgi:hypothetical protein